MAQGIAKYGLSMVEELRLFDSIPVFISATLMGDVISMHSSHRD